MQGIEHLLDSIIIGIDQRIVEYDRCRPSIADKQPCKCKPRQYRQLLAHAAAERFHAFVLPIASDRLRSEERRVGKEGRSPSGSKSDMSSGEWYSCSTLAAVILF